MLKSALKITARDRKKLQNRYKRYLWGFWELDEEQNCAYMAKTLSDRLFDKIDQAISETWQLFKELDPETFIYDI